ncbi:MAG: gliding motility-associated C-terminal domain-containing protein [Bacteroidia bacterium]|nr:gliding motility-associated C-terminal domain-containing protein [Bacteroidia bacterium]
MKKIYKFLVAGIVALSSITAIAQPVNGTTTFFTTTTTALQANTTCSITKSVTLSGWLLTIKSTSNCGMNWTASTGGDGRYQNLVGFGTLTEITFGSDDGSEFAMNNLIWGVSTSSWTSKSMRFVGYKNGSPVSGATLNATTPSGTGILNTLIVTFTSNTAFYDVDEIRLAPNSATCNSILFFEEITIGTPSAACTTPTLSVTGSSNVLCNGGSTGSATMSASGGSGFTYTWYPSGGNSSSATGLSAGIYTLWTTNGCSAMDSQTIQITEPVSALSTSTAMTSPLCNGNNGSATVTASGGTSPYTYTWSSGPTSSVEPTLLAGTYTVKVTDNNGCNLTKSVTVTQPSALVTNTAITSPLCNGGNGSATVTATGGTGAYSYTWSSGPTTSVEPTLLAGTYTVRATDASGCNSTKSVTITEPTALVTSTAMTPPLCNGGNGSATVTASGGTGAYSYTWSSGPTTSVEPTLLAGTYTVRVTDASGCTSTKSVTVTQPSAVSTTTGYTNVLCFGGVGSASILATGGTGPYTYTWSTATTGSFITGVPAGSYTAMATDANNCTSATRTIIISQPASALSTATAVTNVLCFGNATGAATVTASGGTGTYTFSWSSGQTTSVITGQTAGVKTVTVTDQNLCTSTNTVTISQPGSGMSTGTAVTNVACFGAATGAATVTVSGGSTPYGYVWSGAQTTSVITGQTSGVRTVTITDASSCTSTATVNISQPAAALSSATVVTNVLCFGASTGTATLTVSGGTSPYSYLWSGAQTTSVISGQNSGVRTVTVTDANSCTVAATANISQPASALSSATAVTNVLCFGASTGAATLTASGGTSPYTYLWSGAQTTSVISGQTSGVRTVTVTDANSCTTTNTINITQPASGISTGTAVVNVLCFGAATGAATVTASGGDSPYTYLWSGAQTTSVITGQTSGVRTVTITDASGCTSTATANMTQPASALSSATVVTNVLCFGASTGSATLTVSGGTSPYSYLWSSAQTTSVISGQNSGVRTVTVTDANSCTVAATANIAQPASALNSATAVTNVLCFGASTGAATLTASGGTSPYTYLWSGAQTTSVISGQSSGVITVTVTDANACNTTNTVNITQPGSGMTTGTAVTNVSCFGNSTGAATVTASGGSGSYTYLWSGAQTTSVISGQTSGVKTVTVTDAGGCTSSATVNITQPASALSSATAVTNVLCFGASTGSATLTVSGGTSPYSYLWSGAQTTSVISGQTSGVRTVTVTDANSCTVAAIANITQPASALSSATAVTNVLCFGASTGSATLTVSGGTSPYSYAWSGAQTTSVISGQTSGVRTVTVTDANACNTTNTVNITQPASGMTTGTAVANVLCFGASTGAATVTVSGGTSPYSYLWSSAQTTSVISSLNAGVRTVTVTDASGCTSTNTVAVTQPASVLSSVISSTNPACNGNTGSATLTASGGTGAYTYSWSSAATTSVISGLTAGVYTGTVTDANGCQSSGSGTITVPSALTINAVASSPSLCSGNSSTLTASGSGGTGAITYTWVSGPITATTAVSPLSTTIYTVNAKDANNCTSSQTVSVLVSTTPTISVNSATICSGATATLSASGASSYTWSTASNSSSIIVSPTSNTSYSVSGSNTAGCLASQQTVTVSVSAAPSIVVNSNSICIGASATLIATGVNTYSWSNGATTSSIVVTPATNTTYVVNGTLTGCAVTASNTSSITVNALPTVAINSGSICAGQIFTLTPSGANTYTITGGTFTVSPSGTSSYSVTGTSTAGCVSSNTAVSSLSVFSNPTISVASPTICGGATATLSANGASTYTWSTASNATSITVSPTITTSYSVNGTSTAGCIGTVQNATVTVSTSPSISVNSGTICAGQSVTLSASGVSTYSWNTGATTSSIVVSPATNSVYAVTGTLTGCSVFPTNNGSVTVNALPTVAVNSGSICAGQNFTLTPSGANTYTITGGTFTVSPSSTSSYSVTGTSTAGCVSSNTAVSNLTVYANPTIAVSSQTICSGSTATLSASGANTYTWSTSANTSSIVVSPTSNTSYSVNGTSTAGCVGTSTTATVTISSAPAITVNSSTICAGQTTTLAASGVTTYSWNTGATTSSIVVTPATNSVYIVSGTLTGCSVPATNNSSVTVNPLPTLTVNSGTICSGQIFTIIPGGAVTYTYSSGSSTVNPTSTTSYSVIGTGTNACVSASVVSTVTVNANPTITAANGTICVGQTFTIVPGGAATYVYSSGSNTVSPATTTNYSVTGTSSVGCVGTNTAVVTVSVFVNPTISVGNGTICSGQVFTLSPSGANTYSYSSGSNTVNPTTTTSYSISGTSTDGCVSTSSAVATVSVFTSPTVSVNSGTICAGQSFTLSGSGANTFTYSAGSVVTPANTTTYSVIGSSTANCVSTNTAIATVTVFALPGVSVTAQTICNGSTATLVATGANTYLWSNAATTSSNAVSPTVNTNYTVVGTSTDGCVGLPAIGSVSINPTPTITVNSGSICAGGSFVIVPSGAATYVFSGGSATVNPAVTTTYSVTGTSSLGCSGSNTALSTITVIANPILTITASSASVCSGNSSTLTVSGANTYTWQTGANTNSINVTPATVTSYSVIGASAVGCVNTATSTVGLFPNPTITISSSSASVCIGFSSTINASGVSTYSWSTGANTSSIVVSPTVTSTYTVNGTDLNGCNTSTTVAITLNPQPTVTAVSLSPGVCLGFSTNLIASGATTYTWNTGATTGTIAVSPTVASTYSVTGSNGEGCLSSTTVSVSIYANPTVSAGANLEVGLGGNVTLSPTQSLAATYSWTPSTYLSANNISNPVATPFDDITYTLTVTSANGCKASSSVNIVTLRELIISNYMSPNGDGANDTWKVNVPVLIKDYSIIIIDSYGRTVYSKDKEYNNEFDGKLNGDDLPDGTYYYIIKDGAKVKYKGSITLTK